MKQLAFLVAAGIGIAACASANPAQPFESKEASFAKATPAYTCASADAVLGTLTTYVRHTTHVQAPATEAALLPPLKKAHEALVATPCDKQGALAAMAEFDAAVDANASSVSAATRAMFRSLSKRIVGMINQVP
jgi:hypothetical protein